MEMINCYVVEVQHEQTQKRNDPGSRSTGT